MKSVLVAFWVQQVTPNLPVRLQSVNQKILIRNWTKVLMIEVLLFFWRIMLVIGRRYREHCVLVIGFKQLLAIIRVVEHKVLLEELLHKLCS